MPTELDLDVDQKILELAKDALAEDPEQFSDREWGSEWADYSPEEEFLFVQSWGPWPWKARRKHWEELREQYRNLHAPLGQLSEAQLTRLNKVLRFGRSRAGKLGWQASNIRNFNSFLARGDTTVGEFREALRRAGPHVSRAALQSILKTSSTKIIDCYLRDFVRVDSFPIDTRVQRVLDAYGIAGDSWSMVEICRRNGVDPRTLARAVYERADELAEK